MPKNVAASIFLQSNQSIIIRLLHGCQTATIDYDTHVYENNV